MEASSKRTIKHVIANNQAIMQGRAIAPSVRTTLRPSLPAPRAPGTLRPNQPTFLAPIWVLHNPLLDPRTFRARPSLP